MRDRELYSKILGLSAPWRVVDVDLKMKESQVVVKIEHDKERSYRCPQCNAACPGYDHAPRRWRHLDTCQFTTVLECSVPRVSCPEHGVVTVRVPWAEPNSRFTLFSEAKVIDWLVETSIQGVSRRLRMSWDEVDTIMARAVARGMKRRAMTPSAHIGVDEKARAKRHKYVTVVVDRKESAVVFVGEGRGKDDLGVYYEQIGPTGCAKIESVTMDMSAAYIAATTKHVPDAERKICFDRFHVAQMISKAVDAVRRIENHELRAEGNDRLKGTRYSWLQNFETMTPKQVTKLERLAKSSLKTAKAWRFKEFARGLWQRRPRVDALVDWMAWCSKACRSGIEPIVRVAESIARHAYNIAVAIEKGISNAASESINSGIKKLSARAHGFRNSKRFINAIYFHFGKLDLHPDGVAAS